MSTDLKSNRVIEFMGKTSNWEGWSEKFKARAKRKGYKKLLLGKVVFNLVQNCKTHEYPEKNCKLAKLAKGDDESNSDESYNELGF